MMVEGQYLLSFTPATIASSCEQCCVPAWLVMAEFTCAMSFRSVNSPHSSRPSGYGIFVGISLLYCIVFCSFLYSAMPAACFINHCARTTIGQTRSFHLRSYAFIVAMHLHSCYYNGIDVSFSSELNTSWIILIWLGWMVAIIAQSFN